MDVSTLIPRIYLYATGKTTVLTPGSTKYVKILAIANMLQQVWAAESGIDWESLRTSFPLGVITATDTYSLGITIGKLSSQQGDFVRITTATQEYDYTIVPSSRLYDSEHKLLSFDNNYCSVQGQSLVFARSFETTDPQFGGTITAPGFIIPTMLVNPSDVILVDDPNWLAQMSAAEYVRTDLTRQSTYPGLVQMANATMNSMKDQNDSQKEEVYTGAWTPGSPNDYPWN